VRVAYKSDRGKKRKNNEDSFYVDVEKGMFLLADGMGGHQAGEVASDLAVREGYAYLKDSLAQADSEKEILKLLVEALINAHNVIKERAKSDLNLMGMGTTLIQVVVKNDTAYICHVGDSRVYLLRDSIKQITRDHTVGDYLVEHKIMRREEVPPQKWHTLTQAVGVSDDLVPELQTVEMKRGDYLLLCTDGLTDMLSDEEIEKIILERGDDANKTVDALIEEANRKGGRDNISVVLIGF
jgi:serine/threonine protein phosphatase PrpC